MAELTVEQRLEKLEYYVQIPCARCKELTPLAYAEPIRSEAFGKLFGGLFCHKCVTEHNELINKVIDDSVKELGQWYKQI